ncbi:MAG: glycosyltransferase family 2 protein [Acidobacteriota bacterium]|nr:glycosyltransferase family 2 protein [Acidobacteriota bacterium]
MRVSIIIVSYNCRDYLIGCLESVYAAPTQTGYEVIVVDNASPDDTAKVVPARFPQVRWIQSEVNGGFSHANNQGIAAAQGEYLLLLNPDTLVLDNAIDRMVRFMDEKVSAGACGCRVLNEDGSLQPTYFGFPTLLKDFGHLLRLDRRWVRDRISRSRLLPKLSSRNLAVLTELKAVTPVDFLLGACLMVRRSALEKVGMLDDRMFMYSEEAEFCYRLHQHGFGVYYLPEGRVVHFGGQSTRTASDRMLLEYNRSRLYFDRRCHGWLHTAALKGILAADMLLRLASLCIRDPQSEIGTINSRYRAAPSTAVQARRPRAATARLYLNILREIVFNRAQPDGAEKPQVKVLEAPARNLRSPETTSAADSGSPAEIHKQPTR